MSSLGVFTNTFTAQKVVTMAERKAGGPGYHLNTSGSEDLTAPAYVQLQAILDHQAQRRHWPFRHDARTLTLNSRITALPLDFWRAAFNQAFLVDVNGVRSVLPIIGLSDFHSEISSVSWQQGTTTATGRPQYITIFKHQGTSGGGTGEGKIIADVTPDTTYYLELHYDPMASPLSAITSVPWFPWSQWLIEALVCDLYLSQDDSRYQLAAMSRDKLMREILDSLSDPGQRGAAIGYDPLRYVRPMRF